MRPEDSAIVGLVLGLTSVVLGVISQTLIGAVAVGLGLVGIIVSSKVILDGLRNMGPREYNGE